jgi:hypothetical protein
MEGKLKHAVVLMLLEKGVGGHVIRNETLMLANLI